MVFIGYCLRLNADCKFGKKNEFFIGHAPAVGRGDCEPIYATVSHNPRLMSAENAAKMVGENSNLSMHPVYMDDGE